MERDRRELPELRFARFSGEEVQSPALCLVSPAGSMSWQ